MARQPPIWLHDVVSALVYSSAANHRDPSVTLSDPPWNDITRFVLDQQRRMPDFLRLPLQAATLGFDLAGPFWSMSLFHSRPPEIRARMMAAWRKSPVGFARDFIRYYDALAAFALHSRDFELPGAADLQPPDSTAPLSGNIFHQSPYQMLRCDIAVIGSGPGGAVTACTLAEGGRDVLLIEEGPCLPLGSCPAFSLLEMRQKYRNGGQTVALGRNKISYVEGCCVGGGSEINSGLYHRTPPEVLEEWRKAFIVDGLEEWDMQPHFDAIERELSVSYLSGAAPAASLKLHQGATALGWKSIEVPRWFAHSSSAPGQGARRSMTRTFIPRFLDAGGALLPRTRIRRMRQESGKWLLEGMHADGREIRILARQLILAAGAVHTPALLRRNGITRNIGNSLQAHPTVKVVARFPEPVNAAGMGVPVHQVKEFAPRLSLGCSISAPPYLALGLLDHPQELKTLTASWHRMANYYAMITPEGRGTVRNVMGFRDPVVRCAISRMDQRNLADGLRKLAETLFAAGAERVFPCISGGPELWSASDLHKLPKVLPAGRSNLMTIHLFSSCPMGEDKRRCATDSYGRVHGFDDLRISDASLLCSAPGVNPQGTIMAIARRNAFHLLGRL